MNAEIQDTGRYLGLPTVSSEVSRLARAAAVTCGVGGAKMFLLAGRGGGGKAVWEAIDGGDMDPAVVSIDTVTLTPWARGDDRAATLLLNGIGGRGEAGAKIFLLDLFRSTS